MSIKKILLLGGLIGLLYMSSVLVRAHRWETEAERYMEEAISEIAKPWNSKTLEKRASWWLLEKSRLRPAEITRLASEELGNLVQILAGPKCNLQQGFDSYSTNKHTYAICLTTAKFEKKTATMKIRLIGEGGHWKNGGWKINDFVSVN